LPALQYAKDNDLHITLHCGEVLTLENPLNRFSNVYVSDCLLLSLS